MRILIVVAAVVGLACLLAAPVSAGPEDAWFRSLPGWSPDVSPRSPWAVDFGALASATSATPLRLSVAVAQEPPTRRVVPVEYSDAYKVRAKIHKITSYATLPLFVANYFVGQHLYDHPGDESMKGLHDGLVASTAVVFGINTTTGAWNLWEGRKDPNHRTKRMTHGILMMIADAGFLATAMLAPEYEHEGEGGGAPTSTTSAGTHRAVALTSMGIATVSYLIMLFGGR
jgi:hypothetical protein